jgi:hypothetical protein
MSNTVKPVIDYSEAFYTGDVSVGADLDTISVDTNIDVPEIAPVDFAEAFYTTENLQ